MRREVVFILLVLVLLLWWFNEKNSTSRKLDEANHLIQKLKAEIKFKEEIINTLSNRSCDDSDSEDDDNEVIYEIIDDDDTPEPTFDILDQFKIASWAKHIPRWELNTNYTSRTAVEGWDNQVPLEEYPEVLKFFKVFPYGPPYDGQSVVKSLFKDLNKFLASLRKKNRNMFVSPIENTCHVSKANNVDYCTVLVNVVWESGGWNKRNLPVAFGAFGDVGFIEFELNKDLSIKNFKFRLLRLPPEYKTVEDTSENQIGGKKVNDLPSFFADCEFSGRYIYVHHGWFDHAWLSFWGVGPNGDGGISSFDATGPWSVGFWSEPGWKGNNLIFTDQKEFCFFYGLGWMNDKTSSLSVIPN